METFTFVGSIVGMVGGLAGLFGAWYMRKQASLMQEQLQRATKRDTSAEEWAKKFDDAVALLNKVACGVVPISPSSTKPAYEYIIRDEDLRGRIKRYLGRRPKFFSSFQSMTPTADMLQNPVVQLTIQEVLDLVAKFKAEHADFARALGLLPKLE